MPTVSQGPIAAYVKCNFHRTFAWNSYGTTTSSYRISGCRRAHAACLVPHHVLYQRWPEGDIAPGRWSSWPISRSLVLGSVFNLDLGNPGSPASGGLSKMGSTLGLRNRVVGTSDCEFRHMTGCYSTSSIRYRCYYACPSFRQVPYSGCRTGVEIARKWNDAHFQQLCRPTPSWNILNILNMHHRSIFGIH